MYYNTTNINNPELALEWSNAMNQEDTIMNVFNSGIQADFSPHEMKDILEKSNIKYEITSIRRAFCTLTDSNKLIKTNIKRVGKFGKVNFCWKLNPIK